jgi:hypothetical protein
MDGEDLLLAFFRGNWRFPLPGRFFGPAGAVLFCHCLDPLGIAFRDGAAVALKGDVELLANIQDVPVFSLQFPGEVVNSYFHITHPLSP